jgi:predicted hydrocarbon binding protein
MEKTKTENEGIHRQPVAFFLMPVEILKGVHEELSEVLGPETASKVIYNCGFRSGEKIVNDMDISFPDLKTLCETLPELWLQMGMGNFKIEELNSDKLVLRCIESNEAEAQGNTGRNSCDLTSGYLAGMLSTIFEKKFTCREMECMSNGSENCLFELHAEE